MLQNLQNRLVAIFASSTMVLFGLLGMGQAVLQWQEWATLTADGMLLEGAITAKEDNFPLGYNYRIFYDVDVDGDTISHEERVTRSLYRSLEIGQAIDVRSLPEHSLPLAMEGNNGRLIGFTATAGLWIFVGITLGLFLTAYLNRLTRLRRELPELDLSVLMTSVAANAEANTAGSEPPSDTSPADSA